MIKAKDLKSGKFYSCNKEMYVFIHFDKMFPRTSLKVKDYFLCLENKEYQYDDPYHDYNEIKIITKYYIGYLSCYNFDADFIAL